MSAPVVLLLDHRLESQKSVTFLLGIAKYQVRAFDDESECLNWFSIIRNSSEDILSILINGEIEKETIDNVLMSIEQMGHFVPVLILDRFKSMIKKEEFLHGIYTKLPIYVCEPSQIMTMLNHFTVLKRNLAASNRNFRNLFAS